MRTYVRLTVDSVSYSKLGVGYSGFDLEFLTSRTFAMPDRPYSGTVVNELNRMRRVTEFDRALVVLSLVTSSLRRSKIGSHFERKLHWRQDQVTDDVAIRCSVGDLNLDL